MPIHTQYVPPIASEDTNDDVIVWYWVCLSEVNYSQPYLNQEDAQAASDDFNDKDGYCNYYDNHEAFHRVLYMRWGRYKESIEYADKINEMIVNELPKDTYDQL